MSAHTDKIKGEGFDMGRRMTEIVWVSSRLMGEEYCRLESGC